MYICPINKVTSILQYTSMETRTLLALFAITIPCGRMLSKYELNGIIAANGPYYLGFDVSVACRSRGLSCAGIEDIYARRQRFHLEGIQSAVFALSWICMALGQKEMRWSMISATVLTSGNGNQ